MDHHEIVQVVLSWGCSGWDRSSLGRGGVQRQMDGGRKQDKIGDRRDRG